jgi:protein-disulfide isomerase
VATSLVLLSAAIVVLFNHFDSSPTVSGGSEFVLPKEPMSLEGSASMGSRSARVAMVVFSDFQCPYCARFATEILPAIKSRYVDTGDVRIVFRHLPLLIHPQAALAATAAECAHIDGHFWDMHDALFADQLNLDLASLHRRAASLGLDAQQFSQCLDGPARDRVNADAESARRLAVTSTPTTLLARLETDGRARVVGIVRGAQPFDAFTRELDKALDH